MMTKRRNARAVLFAAVLGLTVWAGTASAAAQVAPVNTAPPTVSGAPTVGKTLTATDGAWNNSPTAFTYQWLRCNGGGNSCTSVTGAIQKTYMLVAADAGRTMRVRVTATNADGSASAQSEQTAAVQPETLSAAPKNTALPTITGIARVGQALTASQGSWSGNPTAYAYQWQRCDVDVALCVSVVGATGSTYGVRLADLGYRLRVSVTARNDKGVSTSNSAITGIVAPANPVVNKRPTLVIISVRFSGAQVYARFRICDDSMKNLTVLATDSRPGRLSYTRRFSTLVPPRPCGVYTRHWLPAARFRGPGKYTVTLKARDKSGLTSLPARRTFLR